MGPKRPAAISIEPQPPSGVTITDTLTLIVKGDGGVEMRVKESGISAPPSAKTPAKPVSPAQETMLNKLKFEDLRIGPELGKGSQGKVRIVQHRGTLEKFALKYLNFEGDIEAQRMALQAELRQVEALKHENVVSSYEAFFRDGKLYIVLEYMDCGTMKDIMRRHPEGICEEKLAYIAREILKGLQYVHNSKVVHRDLKPANVLANSKGEVKIADFGVAKQFASDVFVTLSAQGSVAYMSPERINSQPYSFSCDIWSAGVTVAELAMGEYPFSGARSSVYELCQAITANPVVIQWDGRERKFSKELEDFVAKCLKPVASRPSADELLEHKFIRLADDVVPSEMGKWFCDQPDKAPEQTAKAAMETN